MSDFELSKSIDQSTSKVIEVTSFEQLQIKPCGYQLPVDSDSAESELSVKQISKGVECEIQSSDSLDAFQEQPVASGLNQDI